MEGWTLAQTESWLQKFPCTPLQDYPWIVESHPFEHPLVVEAAFGQPLTARYDPGLNCTTSYHRTKVLITQLIPEALRGLVSAEKEDYGTAIVQHTVPRSVRDCANVLDAGLLDHPTLAAWLNTSAGKMPWEVESALIVAGSINDWLGNL